MSTSIDDPKRTGITHDPYCSNKSGKAVEVQSMFGGDPSEFLQNFDQSQDDYDYPFDPVLEEIDTLAELFDGPVAPDDYEEERNDGYYD